MSSEGGFWKRRVIAPIATQLTQGVTPEKIALTVALGIVAGTFPILGATTALCGIVALAFGLNQPIIQLVNYLFTPVQLATLIPYYRAGEWLLGREPIPLSVPLLIERFSAGFWRFLGDFGMVAVGGILVWAIGAPFFIAGIYYGTRPGLRALAARLTRKPVPAAS